MDRRSWRRSCGDRRRIRRIGGDSIVNSYLIEDAGEITIVDAGLHFAGHDALLVGDALCTYAVTTGRGGPQIAPFSADPGLALANLTRIEGIRANLVLPGHGPAWTLGPAEAVRVVRSTAAA